MISVYIGNHCHLRLKPGEVAVALVHFGDQVRAGAPLGVAAQAAGGRADQKSRIETAALEEQGDHGRGGGLAMGAGHPDRGSPVHQLGQQVLAMNHPQVLLPGSA